MYEIWISFSYFYVCSILEAVGCSLSSVLFLEASSVSSRLPSLLLLLLLLDICSYSLAVYIHVGVLLYIHTHLQREMRSSLAVALVQPLTLIRHLLYPSIHRYSYTSEQRG